MKKLTMIVSVILVTFLVTPATSFGQDIIACVNFQSGITRIVDDESKCNQKYEEVVTWPTPKFNTMKDAFCALAAETPGWCSTNAACVDLCPELKFKIVFVSSETYNGNLGGLIGADAKCQALAADAGLHGEYKSWLSDSQTAARDRITHTNMPYQLVDATLVAVSWSDLVDGSLENPIHIDENGDFQSAVCVWTGTDEWGGNAGCANNPAPLCCSNWARPNLVMGPMVDGAIYGSSDSALASWTSHGTNDVELCYQYNHLYCFQQ